jgi:glyoxylase-like metal-dependent hydrolase (beta-lactamase superfamily II)
MIEIREIGGVKVLRMARTVLGRGLYYTAAYWVDGLLIDTGCAYTVPELLSALNGLRVAHIVNTHSHEDHIGANAAVARHFGAEVLAFPSCLPVLADPKERQPLKPYRHFLWGCPDASQGQAIGDRFETENHLFHVIHTPGHSPDHICLHEPARGWLFSGDAFIGGRDRTLRADYNIWQIIDSLKKMAQQDVSVLFPGSGRVREDATKDLHEKISYLEETGTRVLDLHRRGMGYGRIRKLVFGHEPAIFYFTAGDFSGKHLVRSFVEDRPETFAQS